MLFKHYQVTPQHPAWDAGFQGNTTVTIVTK